MNTNKIDNIEVTISDRDTDTTECNWKDAVWHWDIGISTGDRGFNTHYYGAINAREIEPEEVLYNLLSEALYYYQNRNSFVDYCKEFGYTIDTLIEAEHAYKGSKKLYDEFCRILYIEGSEFEDVACDWLNNHNI
jgi:hypothetical protein